MKHDAQTNEIKRTQCYENKQYTSTLLLQYQYRYEKFCMLCNVKIRVNYFCNTSNLYKKTKYALGGLQKKLVGSSVEKIRWMRRPACASGWCSARRERQRRQLSSRRSTLWQARTRCTSKRSRAMHLIYWALKLKK